MLGILLDSSAVNTAPGSYGTRPRERRVEARLVYREEQYLTLLYGSVRKYSGHPRLAGEAIRALENATDGS
jgi:hypothetical protein